MGVNRPSEILFVTDVYQKAIAAKAAENYSSSYESDNAFESDGFVSGEDGFDTASKKLFVTDPDDETLEESRVVEDCVVSRPFVTDPDEETLEITMKEEEEEEYVDEPLRKQGVTIAMLSRDSDDDSVGFEEEEDDGVLGSVRVPGIRISEKTEVEGGEDESQFEPVMGSSEGCIALKDSNTVFTASHSRSVRILEEMDTKLNPEEVIEEFEMLTKDAKRVQKDTLQKILEENGSTEYLKKWGLNGRTDHESFKAFVAFVTHKDLEPYIQRMVDVHSVCQFLVSCSSGTTQGRPKFFPFNNELIESTMQMYKTSFAFRNREFPIGNGKALQFIYSSKQFKTKGGLAAGTTTTNVFSGSLFKNTMKAMRTQCCSPDEVIFGPDFQQSLYCHLLSGLIYWNEVQVVSSTFAHSIVYAFRTFEQVWEELRLDIREGVLTTKSSSHPYEQLCLYRYRLGDVVKVVGFHNSTPELQFICRSNLLLTINIDKNTEKDVQLSVEAAGKLFSNKKLEVVDFTSHVDLSTDPGHYVIFWEVSGEAGDDLLRECCNCLDRSFVDAGYVGSRKVKPIGALELRVLKRGTFQKILEHYVGLGAAVSQFKTPRCVGPANSTVLQILCNNVVKSYFSTAF
ncbi:Jasmonoyl--L-amino acid synthetase JAR6 [Camellia lanceoleosa]|uniref:Jasmonoyl--L-amino acid synthetase JAR6 n=1 Tax=Camellia lanceoleosa TaxID=1840588 RepID=A0ACC0IB00_9ERIC|nr:Jasmonoyl--L-amino acid synthetase JAR6 [Camellia lanceoleosa]